VTILRFALKRALRSPANILLLCVLPVGVVFVPAVPGSTLPLGFHLYGQVILYAAFLMVRAITEDRLSGVLTRVAAAPVSYPRYLAENLLAYGALLVLQSALVVTLGVVVYGPRLPSPFLLFVAYTCFSLVAIAFTLAWCSLFGRRDIAYGTLTMGIIVLSMLGGFYWPIEIMPEAMQRVAMVTPPYWMIEAARVLQRNGPPGRFVLCLAIMLLFTVAFLVVGSRRRME